MTSDPVAKAGTALSPEWDRGFDEAFTELITSDPDLVAAEFDALIGANFDEPPTPPAPPAPPVPSGAEPAGTQPATAVGPEAPAAGTGHQPDPADRPRGRRPDTHPA
ncbi:hypothetical protein [Paractinoplanes durhamensis]|uniref:hypothetical protein n=1 Tax=Paractinoplanes durhamensis TaxID=113563 RepID=UPI003642CAA2